MEPALQAPLPIASFLHVSATHQQGYRPDHYINIQSNMTASHPNHQDQQLREQVSRATMVSISWIQLSWPLLICSKKQANDTSQPVPTTSVSWLSRSLWVQVLNSVKKQTRVTEDSDNSNPSNGAEPQPSTTRSPAQNAMESSATGMLSPPASRPGTPELPPAPPPSPTVGARDALLSRPCVPNYSLHHAASTPNGEKRNG